jgi:hypothetical protein
LRGPFNSATEFLIVQLLNERKEAETVMWSHDTNFYDFEITRATANAQNPFLCLKKLFVTRYS